MRRDKKILVLALVLATVFLSAISCTYKKPFEFLHDVSEIEKIELVDFGCMFDEDIIKASYPIEDINAFISDFKQVESIWGEIAVTDYDNVRGIRITYSNGDYEDITIYEAANYYKSGEAIQGTRMWCFDREQFNELLEKYSPPRDSGDVVEYEFIHPETDILKVEIVDVRGNYNPRFPIKEEATYQVNDMDSFLSDFRDVECRKGGWMRWSELELSDTMRIIKISYAHGEYEYIGADGYLVHRSDYTIAQEENYLSADDRKCFNSEQFAALIAKYSR